MQWFDFWANFKITYSVKTAVSTYLFCGQLLGKIGLIFILTPGHTAFSYNFELNSNFDV